MNSSPLPCFDAQPVMCPCCNSAGCSWQWKECKIFSLIVVMKGEIKRVNFYVIVECNDETLCSQHYNIFYIATYKQTQPNISPHTSYFLRWGYGKCFENSEFINLFLSMWMWASMFLFLSCFPSRFAFWEKNNKAEFARQKNLSPRRGLKSSLREASRVWKEKLCSAADYLTSQPSSLNAIVFVSPKNDVF